MRRLVQSKSRWRSSPGTPSTSARTSSGISAATSSTKSTSPFSATASTMALAYPSIDPISSPTALGVNTRLMMRRRLVCSGGSMFSIIWRSRGTSWGRGSRRKVVPSHDENVAWSRDTASTSAWRVTAQKPGPAARLRSGRAGSSIQATGASRRRRVKTS